MRTIFNSEIILPILLTAQDRTTKQFPEAKNILVLKGYDGLAGDRRLAFKALKNNKDILQKIFVIEEKIILLVATGDRTTGSGCITSLANILCEKFPSDK